MAIQIRSYHITIKNAYANSYLGSKQNIRPEDKQYFFPLARQYVAHSTQ